MSEFIIASISDADKFIQYDKLGKMCITNRREKAARFSDSGKAWRILTTQMSKKKRDGWKVIAYESETSKNKEAVSNSAPRFKANIDVSSLSDESFNWDNVKHNITESFSEIIAYKERLAAKLNRIEAELCDCEHACEFFKCDAAHGYKLYAMIRERRIKRRYYKDEIWRANAIEDMVRVALISWRMTRNLMEILLQIPLINTLLNSLRKQLKRLRTDTKLQCF